MWFKKSLKTKLEGENAWVLPSFGLCPCSLGKNLRVQLKSIKRLLMPPPLSLQGRNRGRLDIKGLSFKSLGPGVGEEDPP